MNLCSSGSVDKFMKEIRYAIGYYERYFHVVPFLPVIDFLMHMTRRMCIREVEREHNYDKNSVPICRDTEI